MSQQPPDRPPEGWGPPPEGPPVPPQGWGPAPGEPTQPLPGAPGQGWGQQPPQKPRGPWYRRPWPIIGLAVVVGLVLFSILGALAGDPEPTSTGSPAVTDDQSSATTTRTRTTEAPKATAAPAPEAPVIGTPVRDGKFEFTVRKVDCGKSQIGNSVLNTKAQGQFCLVNVKVENIGKEAQLLDGSSQYLYGPGGERFDADSEAAIYLDDAKTFLEEINPGNAVNGIVVFDIPKNVTPTKIELHDSPFSGGVTVEL
jgi:Domain of unknown function (DUF4352)